MATHYTHTLFCTPRRSQKEGELRRVGKIYASSNMENAKCETIFIYRYVNTYSGRQRLPYSTTTRTIPHGMAEMILLWRQWRTSSVSLPSSSVCFPKDRRRSMNLMPFIGKVDSLGCLPFLISALWACHKAKISTNQPSRHTHTQVHIQ